jgi:NitT/TauT family transport system ATP-binding protein
MQLQASEPAETPPLLGIASVGRVFPGSGARPDIVALQDISFDIVADEICVLLGPSGCGKSTLLRIIAGLDQPTSGTMWLDGQPVEGPGRDRGMVFQDYTSFPWLTVRENVEYGLRLNGMPRAERREKAEHFIRLVHLEGFADAWPGQLSGGMRQRVAIARTLANGPRLLLMDEPFGALDAETRWHMQELLLEIRKEHRISVVMVTHDVDEAIFLADRIVFLSPRPGRVKEIIRMDFKRSASIERKEDLLENPEFQRVSRHVMANMRKD